MDEDTFGAFYARTARALWAYLSRMTGSPDLADDLLQETYYRFLRAHAPHESDAHRRNSLFRIATNLARDGRRHDRRAQLVALPDGSGWSVRSWPPTWMSPETPSVAPMWAGRWRASSQESARCSGWRMGKARVIATLRERSG